MEITKNMKAGYQGKRDAMRIKAEKLLNHPGSAKDVYYSKSCADKDQVRAYKTGGHAKKHQEHEEMESKKYEMMEHRKSGGSMKKDQSCQKFAMGGVAKIRHEEATAQGLPKEFKKKSLKDVL
ncbi:MAG: hypothetical protein ACP5N7_05035 [Candidatus Pacearchaeota archaeon]